MIITDVHWTDAESIAIRHIAAVAVEHGWRVQWCRRCADVVVDATDLISESVRLELRRPHRATIVVRVEAVDVWADGSHEGLPWSEHVAGRPGRTCHDDSDHEVLIARLRALGEAAS